MSILVCYATVAGSTQEVAEAVAATLREGDLVVECRPMRDVKSLEAYSAVVMGAAIYMLRLRKEAHRFLAQHRDALSARPVAIFAMGPFHDDPKEWGDVRGQLDKELAKHPWFKPFASEIFGGKFDPAKLRFPYRYFPVLKNMPASDIRDWKAIRGWANKIAGQLHPVAA